MSNNILLPPYDPMGTAISDFFNNGKAAKLRVFSENFEEDEIPVKQLFRKYDEMSGIEHTALTEAKGKILDVGAGSGCHSLALQDMGKDVTAIDISCLSAEIMERRGVKHVINADIYDKSLPGCYDTILMLMNGSGIIGKLDNMEVFFTRIKELLAPNGMIIMDSSDLKYLYEDEDGSYAINIAANYYGEIRYRMKYKNVKGKPFDWLYIDFHTLSYYASLYGFKVEMIKEGNHYDYLASLSII